MSIEYLRVTAFIAYLTAWLVLAAAPIVNAISRRQRRTAAPVRMTVSAIIGLLLQSTAALPITLSLRPGPLRPHALELAGALALAPLAAVLFWWALRSERNDAEATQLVTGGPYAWLRHPIYLGFLGMLLATGLLASAGFELAAATALYVAGTELRIAAEEAELEKKFPDGYARYRLTTRWRYLPGLR